MTFSLTLPTAADTAALAQRLGQLMQPGDVLGLDGPLGVGKTCFVQGLAAGLGVPPQVRVTSPTFTLVNEYTGRLTLYHVDLYRLKQAGELRELGLWELADTGGVLAVEWLGMFPDELPADRLLIEMSFVPAAVPGSAQRRPRQLVARAQGPQAAGRLLQWQAAR